MLFPALLVEWQSTCLASARQSLNRSIVKKKKKIVCSFQLIIPHLIAFLWFLIVCVCVCRAGYQTAGTHEAC
jgi:hypothetical protein